MVPESEIQDFFEKQFLSPLNIEMDNTSSNVPAECIRQKRQQTNHIRNILLTLRRK